MKLSISNIGWAAEDDKAVYQLMRAYGYTGLEIAPTRIFPKKPYEKLEEAERWSNELRAEYGLEIVSMQSIWFGRQENIFESETERQMLIDYTKKAINFAETIGCKNLVFGCPKNRNLSEDRNEEDAVSFFKEIGDYAAGHNTVIGMEANPPIYNTNYVNNTLSAIQLIKKVNSKGFLLNLDVGTMIQNNEDVSELSGNVHLINHVHISEPGLRPVKEREIHRQLNEMLQMENYFGFVSIEMGYVGAPSVIENKLRYVRDIFADGWSKQE